HQREAHREWRDVVMRLRYDSAQSPTSGNTTTDSGKPKRCRSVSSSERPSLDQSSRRWEKMGFLAPGTERCVGHRAPSVRRWRDGSESPTLAIARPEREPTTGHY